MANDNFFNEKNLLKKLLKKTSEKPLKKTSMREYGPLTGNFIRMFYINTKNSKKIEKIDKILIITKFEQAAVDYSNTFLNTDFFHWDNPGETFL